MKTVLGVSQGAGIALYPFKHTGIILGNIEVRSEFLMGGEPKQYWLNFPGTFYTKDTAHVNKINTTDILISSPKCGYSSMLALSRGKVNRSHKGEPSLELSLFAIRELQPEVFLLENLPKLLNSYSLRDFEKEFRYNYRIIIHSSSVKRWGNSQKNRKRLVIVGIRNDILKRFPKLLDELSAPRKVNKIKRVYQLLLSHTLNGHFRPDIDKQIAIYGGKQMTYREIQKMWLSDPKMKRIKTPEENFSTAPGVFRDLVDDYPATIRSSNRCFSPEGLTYTPRQRARIMGIPDRFKILDPNLEPNINPDTLFNKACIAVTHGPVYEIGEWFKQALRDSGYLYS